MCVVIVPLAGPDFYTEEFGIRPLYPVGNSTLIEHVFASRPWMSGVLAGDNQLIFVLRDQGLHTDEMKSYLAAHFPSAETVVIGAMSDGAPLSALAGISLLRRHDVPVIIDLADIAFDMSWDPAAYFRVNQNVDAVLPYFTSTNPKFSYLRMNGPHVIETREKEVISSNASAGVYFFRDATTYLRALIYCLQHPDICKVGAAFFVCPSVNGLITTERQVHALEVCNVEPIGAFFHKS